jgi:UPF0716 family protein affecting phage T7 exclusion
MMKLNKLATIIAIVGFALIGMTIGWLPALGVFLIIGAHGHACHREVN